MQRIKGQGATVDNQFTEGDPVGGVPATTVTAEWLNAIQEEVAQVLEDNGVELNPESNNQLAQLLKLGTQQSNLPRNKDLYRITTKDVSGAQDVTLSESEAQARVLVFTGALTADINVIVPDKAWLWLAINATTGSFALTVRIALAGTGVAVPQGQKYGLRSDGVDVVVYLGTVGGYDVGTGADDVPTNAHLVPVFAARHLPESVHTENYTLALADDGTVVAMNSASALTVTIPPNSAVEFPLGTIVNIYQAGAGTVTVAPGLGVTLRNAGALEQFSEVSVRKRATDEWVLAGSVS